MTEQTEQDRTGELSQLAVERAERLTDRQRRVSPEIAAKEVLDLLVELDGDLITYDQLAEVTGLSRTNVIAGVNHLKDEVLGVEGVSFISETGRAGGVALTRDARRAMAFVLHRARIARTTQQRLIDGTISPMAASAVGTEVQDEVAAILKNQRRVQEDLDSMIARMERAGVDVTDRRGPSVKNVRSA